jgi:ATP-dependent exoDNAse (exonuclease V) beta subunit
LKRLLYVAATRARRSLHLLGCARLNSSGRPATPEKNSALGQLWPVVETQFQAALHKFVPKQPTLFTIAAAREAQMLRRLPLDWKLPTSPRAIESGGALMISDNAVEPITFEWVSDFRRHVGTVVHAFLQKIAQQGLRHWSEASVKQERDRIALALRSSGLAEPQIAEACSEVERALLTTMKDPRGRWCLDSHPQAETELGLSGMVNGMLHHVRIDRTFVCDGVRWIIDYKTGAREGTGREAFFDNELRRYSEQLAVYTALLEKLYKEPIRAGLYFPVSAAWRELPIAHGATAD